MYCTNDYLNTCTVQMTIILYKLSLGFFFNRSSLQLVEGGQFLAEFEEESVSILHYNLF